MRRDGGYFRVGMTGMTEAKPFGILVEGEGEGRGQLPGLPKLPELAIAESREGRNEMIESGNSAEFFAARERTAEERYAYYRRCQVVRRNGEQCKAPAEKGAQICHAHAGQQAAALRRKLESMVV